MWFNAIETESGDRFGTADVAQRAADLVTAINSNAGIAKLATNPLLLAIIGLINWRGTRLPNRRVELYQIATETLIENWPLEQRHLTLDATEITSVLEPIAFSMVVAGSNNFMTEHELIPMFEAQVREIRGANAVDARTVSRQLLRTIQEDTGFFLEKGYDEENRRVYGFLHLTFAEYLAARHLAEEWSNGDVDLVKYAHDPRWHEVMLLMAGHVGTWAVALASRLLETILGLDSEYENLVHTNLFLAADILADNVRVRRELLESVVGQLVDLAVSSQQSNVRTAAFARLTAIRHVFEIGDVVRRLDLIPTDDVEIASRRSALMVVFGAQEDDDVALVRIVDALRSSETVADWIADLSEAMPAIVGSDSLIVSQGWYLYRFATPGGFLDRLRRCEVRVSPFAALVDRARKGIPEGAVYAIDGADLAEMDVLRLLEADDSNSTLWSITSTLLTRSEFEAVAERLLSTGMSETVDASVRTKALRALQETGLPFSAVDEVKVGTLERISGRLAGALDTLQQPLVRAAAVRAVAVLAQGKDEWWSTCRRALGDRSPDVRVAALQGLIWPDRVHVPKEIEETVHLLLGGSSKRVRCWAAHVLIREQRFEHTDIRSLLDARLGWVPHGEDWMTLDGQAPADLVVLASRAGDHEELRALVHDRIVNWIGNADVDRSARRRIGNYWWRSRLPVGSLAYLAEAAEPYFSSESRFVRRRAVSIWMFAAPSGEARRVLPVLFNDDDHSVRTMAINWVGASSAAEHISDVLLEAVQHPDVNVAYNASQLLAASAGVAQSRELMVPLANLVRETASHAASSALWTLSGTSYREVEGPPPFGLNCTIMMSLPRIDASED